MNDINKMSVVELNQAFQSKKLSPTEVMQSTLDRIEETSAINAMMELNPEFAMKLAKDSEERWMKGQPMGILDGIPVSVKDFIDVKDMPTRKGTMTSPEEPKAEDNDTVACLRAKGALIYAKTTTSEFANKIVTESPLTGITRNPWDLAKSPGGSSGGSAAAVAAGINPLSIGTDGGGSIRIPASWSGIFGHKPTGRLLPIGNYADHRELSHIGPMTRNVTDAAIALTILANHNRRDFKAIPPLGTDYTLGLNDGVKGLRIAFTINHGMQAVHVSPDVEKAVRDAANTFKALGAEVIELDKTPVYDYDVDCVHGVLWITYLDQMIRKVPEENRHLIDPDCLELAAVKQWHPKEKFVDALERRYTYADQMHRFFDDYDLLICPTVQVTAPSVPGLPEELNRGPYMTSWVNETTQPGCSIPCGFDSEGMPIGLQIVGRRFDDSLILKAARACEEARGEFPMPPEEVIKEAVK